MLAFTALGAAALDSCFRSWPLAGIKSSAKQSKAKQSKANKSKAAQRNAKQSKAKPCKAKQSGFGGLRSGGRESPQGAKLSFLCGQRLGTFSVKRAWEILEGPGHARTGPNLLKSKILGGKASTVLSYLRLETHVFVVGPHQKMDTKRS